MSKSAFRRYSSSSSVTTTSGLTVQVTPSSSPSSARAQGSSSSVTSTTATIPGCLLSSPKPITNTTSTSTSTRPRCLRLHHANGSYTPFSTDILDVFTLQPLATTTAEQLQKLGFGMLLDAVPPSSGSGSGSGSSDSSNHFWFDMSSMSAWCSHHSVNPITRQPLDAHVLHFYLSLNPASDVLHEVLTVEPPGAADPYHPEQQLPELETLLLRDTLVKLSKGSVELLPYLRVQLASGRAGPTPPGAALEHEAQAYLAAREASVSFTLMRAEYAELLLRAVVYGDVGVVAYLAREKGVDVEAARRGDDGATALYLSSYVGDARAVAWLLQQRGQQPWVADVDARLLAPPHSAALHAACERVGEPASSALHVDPEEVLRLLLEAGHADANLANDVGDTPLILAVRSCREHQVGVIRQLLSHGADSTLVNCLGESALAIARRRKLAKIVALLEPVTPKPTSQPQPQPSPTTLARTTSAPAMPLQALPRTPSKASSSGHLTSAKQQARPTSMSSTSVSAPGGSAVIFF